MRSIDTLLLCECAASQSVDEASAARAVGASSVRTCRHLCTAELGVASEALAGEGNTLIACGQQAHQFAELAEELGAADRLLAVDIRDRAGWTADATAHPKQAALLAEALLAPPPTALKSITAEGVCLVLGGQAAIHAGKRLSDTLAVTCLLTAPVEGLTPQDSFDLALGTIATATGALGGFEVTVDRYAPADPSGRGEVGFLPASDGARSRCDIILDLRGEGPLFPAAHKRNGYLRADPRDPAAVERAIFDALALQGEFEKPLYVRFDASLCAHSRAGQVGCTRCLDVCPTGAIGVAGETVAIDTDVCAGCGACSAVCPSGAVTYDDPPIAHLFARLGTLATTYREAGGEHPRALFHDAEFGAQMIALSARFGRGLPADVIPVEVSEVNVVGHAELLAALGVGFAEAMVLASPRTDLAPLAHQRAIASAILEGVGESTARVAILEAGDPDALEEALYREAEEATHEPILALGGRREVTRLAATALARGQTPAPFALPERAPYGEIVIDQSACTLCLACVSLCPVGALSDYPDRPQVRFQETACVQCGICANACPEDAIVLQPRLDLSNAAIAPRVLNEEEPFDCISCGKPFGVRSTIERIVAKLEGKHWMYTNSDNVQLIKMCDDCRVNAQYHSANSPFRMGERPRVRTTADYKSAKHESDETLN